MTRGRRAALVLVVAMGGSHGAEAAGVDQPVMHPTRDVEVIYSVGQGDHAMRERARFQASTGLQRVDATGGGSAYMVSDRAAGTVSMVNDTTRQVVQTQARSAPLVGRYRRGEVLNVAGLPCLDWIAPTLSAAAPDHLCLTADGVLLRLATGTTERARAVSVQYAPIDPSAFAVPPDYQRLAPRAMTPAP